MLIAGDVVGSDRLGEGEEEELYLLYDVVHCRVRLLQMCRERLEEIMLALKIEIGRELLIHTFCCPSVVKDDTARLTPPCWKAEHLGTDRMAAREVLLKMGTDMTANQPLWPALC